MQPHEVNMDLVLEARNAMLQMALTAPSEEEVRIVIAAVYASIYGTGYTDGFADKSALEQE